MIQGQLPAPLGQVVGGVAPAAGGLTGGLGGGAAAGSLLQQGLDTVQHAGGTLHGSPGVLSLGGR